MTGVYIRKESRPGYQAGPRPRLRRIAAILCMSRSVITAQLRHGSPKPGEFSRRSWPRNCCRSRDRTAGAARPGSRPAGRRGSPAAALPSRRPQSPWSAVRCPSAARAATGPESGILAVQGGGRVGSEAGLGEAGRPAGVRQAGRAGTGGPAGPGPPRGSPPGPGTPAPGATGAARREHDQMVPGRDAGDTPTCAPRRRKGAEIFERSFNRGNLRKPLYKDPPVQ